MGNTMEKIDRQWINTTFIVHEKQCLMLKKNTNKPQGNPTIRFKLTF